ncbi:hypothetical protein K490DRAFT_63053 [Saccharata proteae CBS 121410]|uniref:DUF4219 domain-containing protein n=1 Tax=Saccharata proteae CBS 121410 TaxID=1314787 RepID=A0A9P4I0X4_9PEZI|nr:hypothetical protein K490DRAFT_63053 [Saccharata proteae CBS 121410]
MADEILQPTRLTANNWSEWVLDLRAFLRLKEMWNYTNQKCPDTAPFHEETVWKKQDTRCADCITPLIFSQVKSLLSPKDFDSGYTLFNKLQSLMEPAAHFERITLINNADADTDTLEKRRELFLLMKDLFTLRASADQVGLNDYLKDIRPLNDCIEALNVQLTKDDRALLCFTLTLPTEYTELIRLCESGPYDMSFERAASLVLELHEIRRLHKSRKGASQ